MNAKKIMGAVLVALLAAALFVGAGAAVTDNGTYFAYQNNLVGLNGVWSNGDVKVTISNGAVPAIAVPGTYINGDKSIYLTNPTASYVASGNLSGTPYILGNGGNFYAGSNLTLNVEGLNTSTTVEFDVLRVESPSGVVTYVADNAYAAGDVQFSEKGVWKIQAVWNDTDSKAFVPGVPFPIVDANAFTFNVVEPSDATVTASVDTVYAGNPVSITVKGTPGVKYALNLTGFKANTGQNLNQIPAFTASDIYGDYKYNFTMPAAAEVTYQFVTDASAKDEVKVELINADKDYTKVIDYVTVALAKPVLDVKLGANSYFIGDEIKLTGTSTMTVAENTYKFNITGTNFDDVTLELGDDTKFEGKTFTVYLKTQNVNSSGKKLDVGTYTIKMIGADGKIAKTVTVALKQPFITIADAPEVVVQGDKAEFVINAEATEYVSAYVFGTNFFKPVQKDGADKDISNQFTIELDEVTTGNMSAGQYFAVFQHPMYDGKFNIMVNGSKFYVNNSGDAVQGNQAKGTFLFDVNDRQTANAAQALCDALENQDIDDMYVKASFFVVGEDESFVINEIPTEVVQGTTFTISGVDTANADETVTVQMLSTAFAAVPKETTGSAAFILMETEIAEDGTWEITIDTSSLSVDEYNLAVKIKGEEKKSVTINLVEGADTPDTPDTPDVPDTPDTPDTPTEPETPGFGALAALAGLGAVAVLLLRRE